MEFKVESSSVSSSTEVSLMITVVSSLLDDCSVVDVEIAVSDVLVFVVVGGTVVADADVLGL